MNRGAEREIHDLGSRLVARGHQVTLLTTQPTGLLRRRDVSGIRVHYVRGVRPLSRTPGLGWDETAMFAVPALAASLLSRAEVVHCWHYADAAAVVHRGRPTVLKVTGSVTPEWMVRTPLHERLLKRALARSGQVWCNSEWSRDQMSGFGREMHIVPAGVDRSLFRPTQDRSSRPTVLSTSALDDARKRLVDLLDAWPAVVAAVPDVQLRLAGAASDTTKQSLLERLPESARQSVTFLGALDTGALADEYSTAWAVAMPAVLEALGLSTLEALACGTPVVGADSGCTSALLADPATGTLAPPADPVAFAAAIVDQLDATAAVDRDRCRQVTQAYDWESIVDQVEAAYRTATSR